MREDARRDGARPQDDRVILNVSREGAGRENRPAGGKTSKVAAQIERRASSRLDYIGIQQRARDVRNLELDAKALRPPDPPGRFDDSFRCRHEILIFDVREYGNSKNPLVIGLFQSDKAGRVDGMDQRIDTLSEQRLVLVQPVSDSDRPRRCIKRLQSNRRCPERRRRGLQLGKNALMLKQIVLEQRRSVVCRAIGGDRCLPEAIVSNMGIDIAVLLAHLSIVEHEPLEDCPMASRHRRASAAELRHRAKNFPPLGVDQPLGPWPAVRHGTHGGLLLRNRVGNDSW